MHMADALVSPTVAAVFWAGSAAAIAHSCRKVEGENVAAPLAGVVAAFVFAVQMINFSIPGTGSSGHLGGGLLLAVLLGAHRGFLAIASVLLLQCLFFADGGLLAYGCNVFNIGFIPAFVILPLYRALTGGSASRGRIYAVALLCAVLGASLGALGVVLQTTFSGITALPARFFILAMLPIHVAIGCVEGAVTGAVLLLLRDRLPEVGAIGGTVRLSLKKLTLCIAFAALFVAGVLSPLASGDPDGLEWSILRLTGHPEVIAAEEGLRSFFARIQSLTAILPDYQLERAAGALSENVGTSIAGVVGSLLTLLFVAFICAALRKRSAPR